MNGCIAAVRNCTISIINITITTPLVRRVVSMNFPRINSLVLNGTRCPTNPAIMSRNTMWYDSIIFIAEPAPNRLIIWLIICFAYSRLSARKKIHAKQTVLNVMIAPMIFRQPLLINRNGGTCLLHSLWIANPAP